MPYPMSVLAEPKMKTPLLATTLIRGDRIRSYQVRQALEGWEVSEREDRRVVRTRYYSDWHRVEHVLQRLTHEISQLRSQGWRDAQVAIR